MGNLEARIQSIKESIGGNFLKPPTDKLERFKQDLTESSKAMDYLTIKRGLNQETIANFQLGYDKEKDAIAIPIFKRNELINIRYRYIDNEAKQRYTQERGCEVWLFNEDGISRGQGKGGVLIVEGEFDCMSAWQSGFKNVVSPASGKDSYGAWLEMVDSIPRVFISYDNDKAGKKASIEMAERIGTDKAFEVSYPEGIKDANDYFKVYSSEDYKNLIRKAKPFYKYTYQGLDSVIESIKVKGEKRLQLPSLPFVKIDDDWMVVVSGVSGVGKCHGKGTKILMHDGSIKKVEDIKVGDYLMGINSEPRKVLSLATGKEQMYRVNQKNGNDYEVNESHILSLKKTNLHKNKETTYDLINIPVKEYLNKSNLFKNRSFGWKTSCDWKKNTTDIDPYFLGLWLGDGTSSKTQITSMDKEIKDYIREYSKELGLQCTERIQENNKSITLDIISQTRKEGSNKFLNFLRENELINNKHIPDSFKITDRESRLKLLAGLIDTDGYLSKNKSSNKNKRISESYEITQKNKRLSNDIVFLCRSLGFSVTIHDCIKSIKSTGFSGNYFRINISGDLSQVSCLLKRKKTDFKRTRDVLKTSISVEPIGFGDYYGFTLDGDGLYLLSDFTVTHNTSYVMNLANELMEKDIPTLVLPFERGMRTVGGRFLQVKLNKTEDELISMEDEEWDKILPDVVGLPLYFSLPTTQEVKPIVERAKRLFGVKVVIVDHLDYSIIPQNGTNEVSEMKKVLQDWKAICLENNVIFIVVHHIRKQDVTGSKPKKPTKEDLKGGSASYQVPEAVVLLYKPTKGEVEVIVDKNKGPEGSRIYEFNQATGKIGNDVTDIIDLPSRIPSDAEMKKSFGAQF